MSDIISHVRENHVLVKRIITANGKDHRICERSLPKSDAILSFFFLLSELILGTVHKSFDIGMMQ